jgi:uncharacterized membrane protein
MRLLVLIGHTTSALALGSAVASFAKMPERVPVHFGASGLADRWGDRSELLVALAVLVGVGLCLMAVGSLVVRSLRRRPERMNLPNKARFLALTPAEREPLFDLLGQMFVLMPACVLLVAAVLANGSLRVARGQAAGLPLGALVVPLLLIGAVVVGHLIAIISFTRRLR